MDIRVDLVYGRTGYDVTSYFRSAFTEVRKTAENVASDIFGSNFLWCSVFPAPPIGGYLVW